MARLDTTAAYRSRLRSRCVSVARVGMLLWAEGGVVVGGGGKSDKRLYRSGSESMLNQ